MNLEFIHEEYARVKSKYGNKPLKPAAQKRLDAISERMGKGKSKKSSGKRKLSEAHKKAISESLKKHWSGKSTLSSGKVKRPEGKKTIELRAKLKDLQKKTKGKRMTIGQAKLESKLREKLGIKRKVKPKSRNIR